jgi:hypothetical protein
MKYWVLSRKVKQFLDKEEDPNLNIKAKILLGIQLLWIVVASSVLEYGFWTITSGVKEFFWYTYVLEVVATAPPFILIFVLMDAFWVMRNVGGYLR